MSLHALSDINKLADPIKQFLLDFVITVPENTFNFDSKQLELRAQSFSFPEIKGDTTTVNWGGHERQYAGKQTRQGDWSVRFTEVWSGDVYDGFRKWMQKYHKFAEGTIATHEHYMTTATVNLLNPTLYHAGASGATAKQITLKWLYPTQVSVASEINPSSSDPVDINVTFHYNYFLMAGETDTASESTGTPKA